jgi:hypothetical protein
MTNHETKPNIEVNNDIPPKSGQRSAQEDGSFSAGKVKPVRTSASLLGGMFLEDTARKGLQIEIPSIGVTLTKDNLREDTSSTNK